ncbi:16S rRNA (guanine(527)-N(7))-methyltransferase RsmG [Campylobacter helveticus]|uniref:16S rRNA (guanine(527)-N(7))-methyltransferase RsmG n=1 Tax=Campylobacter helveticus TaxID=28898 RepID=UPI0009D8751A|nr:16S rRNA (guanine(527)-N(7))-methyltransferase RsmG [Campylobacter helveticus]MCR2054141.1 16S rRNA (guanine(527)-N(7))-methyltransferase RsmG [Campylobacter helveticus]MCR2055952.1 16S rRNA (guanine(527)-N(7))-methyltransferase RsmG [Campylobacter helveticus]MCR2061283.1 16S rRNA (guanine(527)-N(7))-methyltransferase RsmG [Campylobacter helveticus]MCR2063804.1 16S rRNA (guanine(527)-N(7))-methyltransferase RsmG [Campylobacter helveticus]TNB60320.1 16S rRNA (guanine(527)-N(7))-methyltransfe
MKFLPDYDKKLFEKRVEIYKNLLKKFNQIHNLTHFKNIDENIQDSIEILNFIDLTKAQNIIDIGSGAGFPAIFLSFLLDSRFYLFEPNAKKSAFLRSVKVECELKNLTIFKEKVQNHKAQFKADFITSRALMKAKDLVQICQNLSDENTSFILYKGSEAKKEMQDFKDYQIYENKWRKYCVFTFKNFTRKI